MADDQSRGNIGTVESQGQDQTKNRGIIGSRSPSRDVVIWDPASSKSVARRTEIRAMILAVSWPMNPSLRPCPYRPFASMSFAALYLPGPESRPLSILAPKAPNWANNAA